MTESEKVLVDELPLAIVRRVVKNKLSECSPEYDVSIHKEAILAFSEGARIFIHYLSATYASKPYNSQAIVNLGYAKLL